MPIELLIFGTGGMAREAAQLARQVDPDCARWNRISFVTNDESLIGRRFSYGEVRFTDIMLQSCKMFADVSIGIGLPRIRREVAQRLSSQPNFNFPNLIHPSVEIDMTSVSLGQGNILTKGVIITCDIKIGDFNLFNWNSTIGHDVSVGSYNVINPGCNLSGYVVLEDACLIGTGAQVLEGRVIKNEIVVGAGSVVNRSLNDEGSTYVGVPARKIGC